MTIANILSILNIQSIQIINKKEHVMGEKESKTFSAQEVCDQFDITKNTLFRWEKEGKITKVRKDWRGWRIFTEDNVKEIKDVIDEKFKKHL